MLGQDYFREFKDEQRVFRDVEAKVAQARDAYLTAIPDGEAKSLGVKLGSEGVVCQQW